MKKGIIFDLDGVLVDTEASHEQARRQIYRKYNIPLEKISHIPVAGRNTVAIFQDVDKVCSFGVQDLRVPIREKRDAFVALINSGVELLPGIRRLIEFARGKLKVGLASASTRSNVESILHITGVQPDFNAVVVAEDVDRFKPDPQTYLKVLEKLGLSGADCVAIEDTRVGMESAKAAGLTVVGVRTGQVESDFSVADLVVEDVESGFEQIVDLIKNDD